MQRAKNTKNDEFYTQYQDIAAECDHYLDQFRNKVIYCNCDTECSNFVRYFLNLKSQGIIRDVIWSVVWVALTFEVRNQLLCCSRRMWLLPIRLFLCSGNMWPS